MELPEPEHSRHRELSDAEIPRWDARGVAWAANRGFTLAPEPAMELQPRGYEVEIEGALVWTDDPGGDRGGSRRATQHRRLACTSDNPYGEASRAAALAWGVHAHSQNQCDTKSVDLAYYYSVMS